MALGMLPAYIPSTVWDDIPGMNLSKIANAISDVGGMCLMAFHCYVRGIRMCCPVLIHNVLPSSLNCQGYISIVKPFLDAHQVALGEILQRAAVDHRSVPNGTYLGCYPFLTHQEVQAPSATKKKKRSIKESDGDLRFDESNVLLYALLDRRLSPCAPGLTPDPDPALAVLKCDRRSLTGVPSNHIARFLQPFAWNGCVGQLAIRLGGALGSRSSHGFVPSLRRPSPRWFRRHSPSTRSARRSSWLGNFAATSVSGSTDTRMNRTGGPSTCSWTNGPARAKFTRPLFGGRCVCLACFRSSVVGLMSCAVAVATVGGGRPGALQCGALGRRPDQLVLPW